jgi:serine/threonine-protein kinase
MFIDEAHISMGLSHSNIVQILDLGVGNGRYFLVMEAVDGWDLGRVLHRAAQVGQPFPRELGLYVAAETCRALAYAHGKVNPVDGRPLGIVHRDVSPQNILLSEQGEVKLTDFGIAKAMNKREHTGTGVVKGKVAFMSPEQALGKTIDARSDLFAVGVVLYQLMCRVRPFEAPTDLEILLRVQNADFKPPHVVAPDVPPAVASIIQRSMQLDPDMRFQSAEEMLTAIEEVARTVFRPVGQTELKRWLAGLGARDGQAPMSKSAVTPPPGRITTGERGASTGEMDGKDVELDDAAEVTGEGATSLASIEDGEIRPRMTRQRAGADELSLPVPEGSESAMSGRHAPLELPLPGGEDERPRQRRSRGGGFGIVLLALVVLGGVAFAGRYYRLMRDKETEERIPAASVGPAGPTPPAPAAEAKPEPAAEAAKVPAAGADAGAAREAKEHKSESEAKEREPSGHRAHGEKAEKTERSESARRIEELKNQMAPDPSLEPAPAPKTEPAPTPAPENP